MRDENAIEQEIRAKGLTAPRLTPELIEGEIVAEYSGRASVLFKDSPGADELSTLTISVLRTRNGFLLVGKSACASPENYDEVLGIKIAREDARRQLWALEGYLLRSKLAGQGQA